MTFTLSTSLSLICQSRIAWLVGLSVGVALCLLFDKWPCAAIFLRKTKADEVRIATVLLLALVGATVLQFVDCLIGMDNCVVEWFGWKGKSTMRFLITWEFLFSLCDTSCGSGVFF